MCPPQREAKQSEPAVVGQLAQRMPLLLLIISLPLGESALLIHFGHSLCLWRRFFLAPEEPFHGSPSHFTLSVLKARHKPLAHLGTDGEGKESPKSQCCPAGPFLLLDRQGDAARPQRRQAPSTSRSPPPGGICSPHSVTSQGNESQGARAQTSHVLRGRGGRQGLHCTTCIGLVSRPSRLEHQLPPGNAHPPQIPPAVPMPTDP